tara:strand:+ start:116 stop:355 length:240 start_codon:yes stop_codon:yes gene_type:complete
MIKKEDLIGLTLGFVIVAVVVALTLPIDKAKEVSKACYEDCKILITKEQDGKIRSSFSYFSRLEDCMDSCIEERNENGD